MSLLRTITAAIAAVALSLTPALAFDPTGTWETSTGESRYAVTLCGDGTALCIELVWLRPEVQGPDSLAMMNRRVVDEAEQATPAKWKGNLTINDMSVFSTITLTSLETIEITGCILIVCQTIYLEKVEG